MTPMIAAMMSRIMLFMKAKIAPANSISNAPRISMRRLPIWSAPRCDPQRDYGVAEQCQAEQDADDCVAKTNVGEIEHEHDRQKTVRKHPHDACGEKHIRVAPKSAHHGSRLEHPVQLSLPNHLLAVNIERVIDDPLSGVDFVIVFESEMAESLSDGFQSGTFGLVPQRVVGVGAVDDLGEQQQCGVAGEVVFF